MTYRLSVVHSFDILGTKVGGLETFVRDILANLPDDFTYVLHLAWLRADLVHLEDAFRANVEGAGLVLQHCRPRGP